MVNLARLFECIELSTEYIADEFGEWAVALEALWQSGDKYYAVFHATLAGTSKYFGYEFWNWETRIAPVEDVETDLAGVLTWYYLAGDYPAMMSTSDGTYIDWRSGLGVDLPQNLSEVVELGALRKS